MVLLYIIFITIIFIVFITVITIFADVIFLTIEMCLSINMRKNRYYFYYIFCYSTNHIYYKPSQIFKI